MKKKRPPKITVPTRVLWGRHDPILKADWADVLDQYFAEVEVSFADDAGHFVHYECPDLAAREIDRFFSGLAQRKYQRKPTRIGINFGDPARARPEITIKRAAWQA